MKKTLSTSCLVVGLLFNSLPLYADQVEMQNGDHYVGKVLSLDTNALILKNENLGTIRIQRSRVTNVTFGSDATNNAAPTANATNSQPSTPTAVVATNGQADLSTSLKALGANTNFIKQIQSQFLAGAGPEANNKFNEMVSGLMSGKMDMNSLRAQAQQAANNLKQMKREVGDDTGMLDGYLSILENFLHESAPQTNSPPAQTPQK